MAKTKKPERKLLQPREVMREELRGCKDSWRDIEQAAGITQGAIAAFVEDDRITTSDLHALDDLNRQ